MNADGNVIKIKHDVLFEIAKLAFAGELEEQRDHLPLKLIPGPTPQFRCCIYKEREIIRQRIRLQKAKLRDRKMMAISSRLFLLPAKTVRSPATQ